MAVQQAPTFEHCQNQQFNNLPGYQHYHGRAAGFLAVERWSTVEGVFMPTDVGHYNLCTACMVEVVETVATRFGFEIEHGSTFVYGTFWGSARMIDDPYAVDFYDLETLAEMASDDSVANV